MKTVSASSLVHHSFSERKILIVTLSSVTVEILSAVCTSEKTIEHEWKIVEGVNNAKYHVNII